MAIFDKNFWHRGSNRTGRRPLEFGTENTVNFGFERVPEAEKVHRTARHFNTVAAKYDFMNTLLSFGIHYLWKQAAVRMMKLRPGDRVIDVCGGTGDLAVRASRAVGPSGRVVIYDINRKMMMTGRKKISCSSEGRRISFAQGDAESIAFPDQTFDAAMVGFGIRNVTHVDNGFREMYRVLKPGGTMMCLEFSKPTSPVFRFLYDMYSFHVMPFLGDLLVGSRHAYLLLPESIRLFPLPDALSDQLRQIGFRNVAYRRLTNGIAVVHIGVKPG